MHVRARPSLFGVTTLTLVGLSIFFTVQVLSRRSTWRDQLALRDGQRVEIVRVVDGDEAVVRLSGVEFTVRLLGLKCLSSVVREPLRRGVGAACAEGLGRRLEGHEIRVAFETFKTDPRDRVLAYLSADGEDVGLSLIESGLGVAFTRYGHPREAKYVLAERRAQAALIGLWSDGETTRRVQTLKALWANERDDAP